MSSSSYWTEIRPDPLLRRRLMGTGIMLGLLGVPVILSLPVRAGVVWPLLIAWLAWCVRELFLLWRAYRHCSAIKLSSEGEVLVQESHATRHARLLPGCLVLDEIAWLRLCDDRGCRWGELVSGKHRESEDWRGFQVILRHSKPC